MTDPNELTEAIIRSRLQALQNAPPSNPYPFNYFNRPRRRAAVLIPFTRFSNEWHLLFIRRTDHEHDNHSGQVAFPGGGQDPNDSSVEATALREAQEEVGLAPQDIHVLGTLEDVISISNYHVTPLVGTFPSPYNFNRDTVEVARIFTIPLRWLAEEDHHEIRYRKVDEHEPWPVIYFKPYDGETLWGFTAALTIRLLKVLNLL